MLIRCCFPGYQGKFCDCVLFHRCVWHVCPCTLVSYRQFLGGPDLVGIISLSLTPPLLRTVQTSLHDIPTRPRRFPACLCWFSGCAIVTSISLAEHHIGISQVPDRHLHVHAVVFDPESAPVSSPLRIQEYCFPHICKRSTAPTIYCFRAHSLHFRYGLIILSLSLCAICYHPTQRVPYSAAG